jgi:dienelactone hydrolase
MDRRRFFAAVPAAIGSTHALAQATPGEPRMRRWDEQRWVLDNLIQANGIDWDQGRTGVILRACGLAVQADMVALRQRVRKYADIVPAFEALARRREALAIAYEKDGAPIPARDNYYIAATYWATAMWPIDVVNDQLRLFNQRKRETYTRYMALADHPVEWVELPYRGRSLSAIWHLPPGYRKGDRVRTIVFVPGMDGYKERSVSLYADHYMQRGYAVLAIEGPGYWEAPLRGIFVDVKGWQEFGKTCMEWLRARPEVDPDRIGVIGSSFGTFFSAILVSDEPRYRAAAVIGTCYEPGGHSIFEEASPTFKRRFMFMSGISDEAKFDQFRRTLDWNGYAQRIRMPFMVVAGEADELSPLRYGDAFVAALAGPKLFMVYQDSRHSLAGPSVNNGPDPRIHAAEWMSARLDGRPMSSERWFIENGGRVVRTPLS